MTNFPISYATSHSLKNALIPNGWWWRDVITHNPANLKPRVFDCAAAGCRVSCHAPVICHQDCHAYGAKRA